MYIDDGLIMIINVFAVVLALILGGIYIGYHFDKKACYTRFKDFQPEYVGWATGCMVTVDEQRVPASSVRMTM